MIDDQLKKSFDSTEKALMALEAAINEPMLKSKVNVDGTIQRFEFTVEIFWKLLKRILAKDGIEASSPREALQKAFSSRLIDDEVVWLSMLRDRNQTSHTYDEELAIEIYNRVKTYYPVFQKTLKTLKKEYYKL